MNNELLSVIDAVLGIVASVLAIILILWGLTKSWNEKKKRLARAALILLLLLVLIIVIALIA